MVKYSVQLKSNFAATTFALVVGTGGYAIPLPVIATNDVSVVEHAQATAENSFFQQVELLKTEFDLGKDQLASLLNVSRPTVYAWLKAEPVSVRKINRERVSSITTWLEDNIAPELRPYLGKMLRRTLDPDVQSISQHLTRSEFIHTSLEPTAKLLAYKLEGLQRSAILDIALADKKPLI